MISTVSPSRLAILDRGINCDNVAMTPRMIVYTPTIAARLKQIGFTYGRIPFEISYGLVGIATPEGGVSDAVRVTKGLAALDAAIATMVSQGLAVMPVLFYSPAVAALPNAEALILQAVTMLAARYAPHYRPDQLFFDILNEPRMTPGTWNVFAPQLVAAIRTVAPDHTLIVPPASWDLAANFSALTPIADPNVVYTMHVYQPGALTMQGAGAKPDPAYLFPKPASSTDPTEWTAQKIIDYMLVGVNWARANHVPLIMNEFGATNVGDPASRIAWAKLVRATADANQIGWAWWAYDGRLFGLNPHGQGYDARLLQVLKGKP